MEAADCETEILSVGRYKFSKKNFEKAIAVIQQNIDKKGWLVIDEIGPLELRGEGFADVLHTILSRGKEKILIVVRESLVDDVKDHFSIQHFIVMDMINVPEELERLN
jgi:nucleoside-triphosphatase THEP1